MRVRKAYIFIIAVILIAAVGTIITIEWRHIDQQNNIHLVQSTHSLTYNGVNGMTALALLKRNAHSVEVKNSSLGQYVNAIDGVTGGAGGKYWIFYVNGKEAAVGAGAYKTKTGETITWKFQ